MDQNKCVALLTAIDLGNLTRAAEQLGYTQSGLSYVIKTLETELGFPLLVRSRTGVRPTEDCQRILPLLRDLDRKSRQLEQEAADIRGLAVGTVSLATFHPPGRESSDSGCSHGSCKRPGPPSPPAAIHPAPPARSPGWRR